MVKEEILQEIDRIWFSLAKVKEKNLELHDKLISNNVYDINNENIKKDFNEMRLTHGKSIQELLLLREKINNSL